MARAAVGDGGELLALDIRMTLDQGSYPMAGFASSGYTNLVRVLIPAAYRLANLRFEAMPAPKTVSQGTKTLEGMPSRALSTARELAVKERGTVFNILFDGFEPAINDPAWYGGRVLAGARRTDEV